jgi:ABC-type uncharacterized transport system substrate-binding protein
MKTLGYEEGRNVHFDIKIAEGDILGGMKPEDIPSQIPLNHRLTVNLKTAKQLEINVDPHSLSLTHRVIE